MSRINQQDAALFGSWIFSASVITLTAHTFPDGDALGSAVALCRYLRDKRGKDAEIVLPNPYPTDIQFIAEGTPITTWTRKQDAAEERIRRSDLLISLDYNAFDRTEGLQTALTASTARKVLIDHHLSPDRSAFGLIFSTPDISSTCEHLFWLLMEMSDIAGDARNLPPVAAAALFAGMTTDTNNFANSTYPSTLRMASALLEAGVDRDDLLDHLYHSYRENRIRLMGYLLGKRLFITDEGVAVMIIRQDDIQHFDLHEGESEGIVNMPLAIGRVRMSILLKEYPDDGNFHISIRSKRGVSAARLARESFHGGGHELAAGGRLYYPGDIPSPDHAERYVRDIITRYFA